MDDITEKLNNLVLNNQKITLSDLFNKNIVKKIITY